MEASHPESRPIFLELEEEWTRLETSRVQLLPCPFDGTSTGAKGADRGPEAMLAVSGQLEDYDLELDTEPYRVGIHCRPPVRFASDDPEAAVAAIARAAKEGLSAAPPDLDPLLLGLGGEHTVSVGLTRALRELHGPFSVLQVDAHADLRDSYAGSAYNHACVMRRIAEDDPTATLVSVGVRACAREEVDYARQRGVHLFPAHRLDAESRWIEEVLQVLPDSNPVYVTFDLDGLDPSILPSTGTPVPGGLRWFQALALLRTVGEHRKIIGADINELLPDGVNHHSEFLAAQLAYKMVAYFRPEASNGHRSRA